MADEEKNRLLQVIVESDREKGKIPVGSVSGMVVRGGLNKDKKRIEAEIERANRAERLGTRIG